MRPSRCAPPINVPTTECALKCMSRTDPRSLLDTLCMPRSMQDNTADPRVRQGLPTPRITSTKDRACAYSSARLGPHVPNTMFQHWAMCTLLCACEGMCTLDRCDHIEDCVPRDVRSSTRTTTCAPLCARMKQVCDLGHACKVGCACNQAMRTTWGMCATRLAQPRV